MSILPSSSVSFGSGNYKEQLYCYPLTIQLQAFAVDSSLTLQFVTRICGVWSSTERAVLDDFFFYLAMGGQDFQ